MQASASAKNHERRLQLTREYEAQHGSLEDIEYDQNSKPQKAAKTIEQYDRIKASFVAFTEE
jgi:hypothetical protein